MLAAAVASRGYVTLGKYNVPSDISREVSIEGLILTKSFPSPGPLGMYLTKDAIPETPAGPQTQASLFFQFLASEQLPFPPSSATTTGAARNRL